MVDEGFTSPSACDVEDSKNSSPVIEITLSGGLHLTPADRGSKSFQAKVEEVSESYNCFPATDTKDLGDLILGDVGGQSSPVIAASVRSQTLRRFGQSQWIGRVSSWTGQVSGSVKSIVGTANDFFHTLAEIYRYFFSIFSYEHGVLSQMYAVVLYFLIILRKAQLDCFFYGFDKKDRRCDLSLTTSLEFSDLAHSHRDDIDYCCLGWNPKDDFVLKDIFRSYQVIAIGNSDASRQMLTCFPATGIVLILWPSVRMIRVVCISCTMSLSCVLLIQDGI